MGLPVTVYRWDDAGAPQLTSGIKPSELINVLKKCLVDGYGAKTGLGWSIPFEDAGTFKIVFRNSTNVGSGGFVQFWSSSGTDSVSSGLLFKCARSMSAIDAFIGDGFRSALKSQNSLSLTHWILIGTSTGFYFSLMGTGTTYSAKNGNNCTFIGDFDSFFNNDPSRFIANTSSADSNSFKDISEFSAIYSKIYATDGSLLNALYYSNSLHPNAANSATYTSNLDNVSMGIPVRYYPKEILQSLTTIGTDGEYPNNSTKLPRYRGLYPGLMQCTYIGFKLSIFPVNRMINNKNHMLLTGQNGAHIWLNIEEWY